MTQSAMITSVARAFGGEESLKARPLRPTCEKAAAPLQRRAGGNKWALPGRRHGAGEGRVHGGADAYRCNVRRLSWTSERPPCELRVAEPQSRYAVRRTRRPWTKEEDEFLRNQWHLLPAEEIAQRLGRDVAAVRQRRRRLGLLRYDGDELTLRALRRLTGLSEAQWRDAISRGWLQLRMRPRRVGAAPVGCVTVDGVRSLLKRHPEVIDYRAASRVARFRLELDSLPPPPRYKRVRCTCAVARRSRALETRSGASDTERRIAHAVDRESTPSCAEVGGTAFWAGIYSAPVCPRCGSTVSFLSPDGEFADALPKGSVDLGHGRIGLAGLRSHVHCGSDAMAERRPLATAVRDRMANPDFTGEEGASASRQTP